MATMDASSLANPRIAGVDSFFKVFVRNGVMTESSAPAGESCTSNIGWNLWHGFP
jgi:hypothetical protein